MLHGVHELISGGDDLLGDHPGRAPTRAALEELVPAVVTARGNDGPARATAATLLSPTPAPAAGSTLAPSRGQRGPGARHDVAAGVLTPGGFAGGLVETVRAFVPGPEVTARTAGDAPAKWRGWGEVPDGAIP